LKTSITIKLVIAGALYACSCFASTIGMASNSCNSTTISGLGDSTFAGSVWQTCGTVMQLGSSFSIDTTNSPNNATLAAVNAFLSPQAVSSQDGITPVEGSALNTKFTSGNGTLSFTYNFAVDMTKASYGFMLLDGTQYDLGHNGPAVARTAFPSLMVPIGAGPHNIAFGVMNGNTLLLDPNITISNLSAPGAAGIPEPSTFGLAAGVFALGFMLRRYSPVSRS